MRRRTDWVAAVVLVLAVSMVVALLVGMWFSMKLNLEASEEARLLIEETHKLCTKTADVDTVAGEWRVGRAELYSCPNSRLVVLRK